MKNKYILTISLLFLSLFIKAQYNVEAYWHQGKILLEDETEIIGELNFNLSKNLLQIKTNTGQLMTYTSRKVIHFSFIDKKLGYKREFYTFPYALASSYETPTFFELLVQREHTSLLIRESFETRTFIDNNPYSWNYGRSVTQNYMENRFYFLKNTGKITPFDGTKKGLFALFGNKSHKIEEYLQENRVVLSDKKDMTRVIDFYNDVKR